ncbi:hypothetical protein UPYG_G00001950 [Umbra pygmaea]|uniref:Galectin n=1 Tax=Umbra pygmaea TaxID=75934 RepID=A0ABD0XJU8_UMBPY
MACQQPILNPSLPFTGIIQGGLYEGKSITVTGRVMPGAQRFHVNLQCGSVGDADIALHFNPQYDGVEDVLVCNTRQHTKWGSEQRESAAPLTRGNNFILMFLVTRDSYRITVNGSKHMDFLHRLPFSGVNTISVDGGVEVQSIAFFDPEPPGSAHSHQQSFMMPYKTTIAGGFEPGRSIVIHGRVNYNAQRFSLDFGFNSSVAFHFNPRFNDNVVVRNSYLNEYWGTEEKSGDMPFHRSQAFKLTIICETQCYKVMVNGIQMFSFNHRHFDFQQRAGHGSGRSWTWLWEELDMALGGAGHGSGRSWTWH